MSLRVKVMVRHFNYILWVLVAFLFSSCDKIEVFEIEKTKQAIFYGSIDDSKERYAVVSMYTDQFSCSGTLISPHFVLTAAHCVDGMYDGDNNPTSIDLQVRFGTHANNPDYSVKVKKVYSHPGYEVDKDIVLHDIAVMELAEAVPRHIAKAIPALARSMAPDIAEVNQHGMTFTDVGYGLDESMKSGTKKYADIAYQLICDPKEGRYCFRDDGTIENAGKMSSIAQSKGTGSGDSGGPTLYKKDGNYYVIGVHSTGSIRVAGSFYSTSIYVPYYYDTFLKEHVWDLVPKDEICDNGLDDDYNGEVDCQDKACSDLKLCLAEDCGNEIDDNENQLVDCMDPQCTEAKSCQAEVCDNEIDDNENGKSDCEDINCLTSIHCRSEICDNDLDDDGNGQSDCEEKSCSLEEHCLERSCKNELDDDNNGKIDCDDPKCSEQIQCRIEICDNKVDDNGNGKVDCEDNQCILDISCRHVICRNKIDDNGDDKIDCSDPLCKDESFCRFEICNNKLDDNDNGKIDCEDVGCLSSPLCKEELCSNKKDDHGDGKVDCDDDFCKDAIVCQGEVCDNKHDDNGNGKVDCEDSHCVDDERCLKSTEKSSEDSCQQGLIRRQHDVQGIFVLFVMFFAVYYMRRYKKGFGF